MKNTCEPCHSSVAENTIERVSTFLYFGRGDGGRTTEHVTGTMKNHFDHKKRTVELKNECDVAKLRNKYILPFSSTEISVAIEKS